MKVTRGVSRLTAVVAATVAGIPLALAAAPIPAGAAATELFFSEYVEGSANNKAIEVFNGTGAAVDLVAGGYSLALYSNGAASATSTFALTGTIADGDVVVIANPSASAPLLALADLTSGGAINFNGDDAIALLRGTAIVDVIGQIGTDPGTTWGTAPTATLNQTLRRKSTIEAGDTIGSDAFDPSVEWDGLAQDTFDGLGAHVSTGGGGPDTAPSVATITPAAGAIGVAPSASIAIDFSEPVALGTGAVALTCAGNSVDLGLSGGPTSYSAVPAAPLPSGAECTVTVTATAVTDVDANDPPDTMAADFTATFTVATADPCTEPFTSIPQIQGSGAATALSGTVTTQGVVVGEYEGTTSLRGFYVQDPTGDADPATSDGIFVFDSSNTDRVSPGDLVRFSGTVAEFQGQTQVSLNAASFTACGTGTVTPTDVTLPFASSTAAEAFEGMLVRLPQTLTVTEHFQLGRFGQVVVSAGGRLAQPTNVVAPGAAANALQAQNNLARIIIDDALQTQNPEPIAFGRGGQPLSADNTLRGGDTATDTVGVMTFTWAGNNASGNAFRVRPIGALGGSVNFVAVNQRPTSAPDVGGSLRVAGLNLLNYFNTFGITACSFGVGGAQAECRGANNQAEFDRQFPKSVAAIVGTGAAVVGINEIENDGYGTTSAVQHLVDQLNAATAPGTYATIDFDTATGQTNALGTDAIKVGVIYQPALVTPVGQTAVLNTTSFVNGGDGAPRNRATFAQAFQDPAGAVFVTSVNHLKSKGSACDAPDAGDGQGNCNQVRNNAATELAQWLATDPTGTADPDVMILGDLNSYALEDPITTLASQGYANLVSAFVGPDAYSYVFDGQWGYLDHALGSASLQAQVTGVGEWHINADEPNVLDYNTDFKTPNLVTSLYAPGPFRSSDHDPVVIGLDLTPPTPEPSTIAFVGTVGGTGAPGDRAIIERLRTQGYDVTTVDDDAVSGPATLAGYDLVVVSSSVVPSKVGTKLADLTIPVVTWEGFLFDEFRLAAQGGESFGSTRNITITTPTHPVAAQQVGTVAILTSATKLNRAVGLGSGVVRVGDALGAATLLAADTGASLTSGVAAARRVGLPWVYTSPGLSTPAGLAIFDAAITWALAASVPQPSVVTVADTSVVEGDSGPTPVSVTFAVTPTRTTATQITFVTEDATAVAPGDYQSAGGTISVPAGTSTATLELVVNGDVDDTVDETFKVRITGVSDDAVIGAASAATVTIVDDDAVAPPTVAFISGAAAGATKDRPVITRLQGAGYDVTVIDDDVLISASVAGYDLVVLSSSVVPAKIGSKLTASTVPVISWEGFLTDELLLAARGSETVATTSAITVVPGHPVAAGLSGPVGVLTSSTLLNQATDVAPGVTVVATTPSSVASVLVADTGAALTTGVAPARRVVLHWTYDSPPLNLPTGWAIFDAAVTWALG